MNVDESKQRMTRRLRAFGYRVKGEGAIMVVPLPLFCNIRILFGSESIDVSPRFGALSRSLATWIFMLAVLFSAGLVWLDALAGHPPLIAILFLVVTGALWDVYRYIITESMITRIQIWLEPEGVA